VETDNLNPVKVQELEQKLSTMRALDKRVDLKPVLVAALDTAEDDEEKLHVLSRLAGEWQIELAQIPFDEEHREKFVAAESVIRQCIDLQPSDSYNWIRLAEHFHYYAVDLQKALPVTNTAIEKAEEEKAFVRQAYGVRIRIALDLKDYMLVEKSMVAIADYGVPSGNLDVAPEDDFLKRIPVGSIDQQVLTRYHALIRKSNLIREGKKYYIEAILDDSGGVVGYAIFDLDGKQLSEVMSLVEAEEWLQRLNDDEEDRPPPPSGSGSGRLRPG